MTDPGHACEPKLEQQQQRQQLVCRLAGSCQERYISECRATAATAVMAAVMATVAVVAAAAVNQPEPWQHDEPRPCL
jgi:hypothetical protein